MKYDIIGNWLVTIGAILLIVGMISWWLHNSNISTISPSDSTIISDISSNLEENIVVIVHKSAQFGYICAMRGLPQTICTISFKQTSMIL